MNSGKNPIAGKHLIAGQWLSGQTTFRSSPWRGIGREYAQGRAADVDRAVEQADAAFETYSLVDRLSRAELLDSIAVEIESNRGDIIRICCDETGLAQDRIDGEFGRTVNQLRFFAGVIRDQKFIDHRHDVAIPDRTPLPRPGMHMVQRPIGPVAVFGASNFPLAFSTAGGDTVAALAAGCPVVVKGHPDHPGTAEAMAHAVHTAINGSGLHPGIFSQIQSNTFTAGEALVQHPMIKAVGFTGSLSGGRTLFNLCAARAEPIPFFGELGSINPVFVLPQALFQQTENIASSWLASLTVGAGQLCTNPGVIVMRACDEAEQFIQLIQQQLQSQGQQLMLSESIARSFQQGHDRLRDCTDATAIKLADCQRRSVTPAVFRTTANAWLNNPFMADEIFGPLGLIVVVDSIDEMLSVARSLQGQLTCSLHLAGNDMETGRKLLPIVEKKAGRIVINGFPTGVEVCDAMVHGGPYPASTNFGATSVGSLSVRRFLRPVCYQNMPDELLTVVNGIDVGRGVAAVV